MIKLPESIKWIITDFDGIVTDNCVYIHDDGTMSRKLNFKDVMGFSILRKSGYNIAIISGEKNLAIDIEKQNLKSSTLFMEEVKSFNPNYKRKSELELRKFNSEESLRLLYVAITRAQKKLYITTSAKAKGWSNKETTQEPSIIFNNILRQDI